LLSHHFSLPQIETRFKASRVNTNFGERKFEG